MVERHADHSEEPVGVAVPILVLAVPDHDRRRAVRSTERLVLEAEDFDRNQVRGFKRPNSLKERNVVSETVALPVVVWVRDHSLDRYTFPVVIRPSPRKVADLVGSDSGTISLDHAVGGRQNPGRSDDRPGAVPIVIAHVCDEPERLGRHAFRACERGGTIGDGREQNCTDY